MLVFAYLFTAVFVSVAGRQTRNLTEVKPDKVRPHLLAAKHQSETDTNQTFAVFTLKAHHTIAGKLQRLAMQRRRPNSATCMRRGQVCQPTTTRPSSGSAEAPTGAVAAPSSAWASCTSTATPCPRITGPPLSTSMTPPNRCDARNESQTF